MKQIILLCLLITSLATGAQEFYSTGDCKASFKFEVNPNIYTLLPATAINFYDTSEGKVIAWYWEFGDNNTSTEQNPMFIFNHPLGEPEVKINPYRTVRLTILTADSCKSTVSQTINIMDGTGIQFGNCIAQFKYYEMSRDSATGKVTFHFDDRSEGKDLKYFWQFGDGTVSTEQNPEVSLSMDQPEFKVCLTVTGADSCSDTRCDIVYLQPVIWDTVFTDPVQQNCIAIFKYYEMERDSASGTTKIHFDNYSEGEGLSYLWQFGDGTTSTEKNPEMKFSLNEPVHKACLTVTGTDSCTSMMCNDVFIQPPVIWDSIYPPPVQSDCYVAFGYERKDMLMGPVPSMLVSFYSKSDPAATEWYWDFGDGTTSNKPNPEHIFYQVIKNDSIASDSVYSYPNLFRTVCLTVKTANECKVSYCETIQVFGSNPEPEKCKVYFKYYQPDDIASIPEVVPIRLVDVSEGEVISRLWQFEDGSTSTEKEPLVTFNIFQPVHQVCLTVNFADGCTNTFCDAVYVSKPPVIDTIIVNSACPYYIKVEGGFPILMSSCAGWASAKVYLNDSLVIPKLISWSTGDTLEKVSGLCPTVTYTVKALMEDGCAVWTNFVLSADGTITPVSPINWWIDQKRENLVAKTDDPMGYKIEWQLCDGTVIEADSIPLNSVNCGDADMNLILKDANGNVVYSENISMKAVLTGLNPVISESGVKLWPNPVNDKLNIRYSGIYRDEIRTEILDILGKQVSASVCRNVSDGYEFNIETSSLKPGIYVCRITSAGKIIDSKKFNRR